jgi:hypothetical protein
MVLVRNEIYERIAAFFFCFRDKICAEIVTLFYCQIWNMCKSYVTCVLFEMNLCKNCGTCLLSEMENVQELWHLFIVRNKINTKVVALMWHLFIEKWNLCKIYEYFYLCQFVYKIILLMLNKKTLTNIKTYNLYILHLIML